MNDGLSLRTVVRDHAFQCAWDALGLDPKASDEVLSAVEWALGRDPVRAGQPTLSGRVWAIPVDFAFEPRTATIYYVFDDRVVRLVDVIFPDR